MTAHREIKKIIYSIKREWGTPIRIEREEVSLDVKTGEQSSSLEESCDIRRAVILPRAIQTDFVYDLSFIAANKNFTYGGNFEVTNQDVLVDARDVRNRADEKFEIHEDDYVYIGKRRYTIQKIAKYDKNGVVCIDPPNVIAYILRLKDLEAIPDVQ